MISAVPFGRLPSGRQVHAYWLHSEVLCYGTTIEPVANRTDRVQLILGSKTYCPHHLGWPQPICKPEHTYNSTIIWRFGIAGQ